MPITAIASITHRITGVLIFLGTPLLLWMLDTGLSSEKGFKEVSQMMGQTLFALVVYGVLAALLYHIIAGIRHLLMDHGIGETKEGGAAGAKIVILLTAIIIVALGVSL